MLYVRILVGIALLLMAAFGPGVGFRRITKPRITHPGNGPDAIGQRNAHTRTGTQDQKIAAVLILRILAALLGLWLIFFSAVQLLHGHGHLPH